MPTITVDKAALFKALGQEYTTKQFDELCFDFGIELDEDTTDQQRPIVDGVQEPPQLKIEIPANRYDMLCFEGIQLMLNIFNHKIQAPMYSLKPPVSGQLETLTVSPECEKVRPYVSGAILRGVTFDAARYASFIDLQDKLHANLARQRTLVSVGTHDLDTIKGPFTYEALKPTDIKFIPLNQTREMNGAELMTFYESDRHLGRYLHIIRDSPVYPVIYDADRTVCSLPPIINGNHSKITTSTKNVFIEITATDRTKVEIVCNILVCMFSQYTSEPFTVEPIKIISPHNGQTRVVPDLAPRETQAEVDYINSCTGVTLSASEICELLTRMSYVAKPSSTNDNLLEVSIPPTRADVLHQADIMEDVCIAYGFNDLPRAFPSVGTTIAQPLPINKLSDIIRLEAPWPDGPNTAVRLANPKTAEYQVVRTSLLPGLLKTIRENKHHSLPMKVFEVSDVAFKAPELERKARNERHFAAAWYGKTSGFEVVHGLMDRIMSMLKTAFTTREEGLELAENNKVQNMEYWIQEVEDATFFEGHSASIHVRVGGKESVVGVFGILHPSVLEKFELRYPVSTLEVNVEVFL
ncbi:Phenylalanine--tRNA ligase beta subunit [Cyphellophora attinorum]|uniref:Phenylalanine--tRNA ligase beta subunit n=1 Tax=Cyphellophora attinorum TaxID=1664694 RepID=A0A0N1NYE6_9EURO|nr:Phenylalanine--tRNA ligase beta subunit [Phialophora attinorum]KPI36857.1 Phenylalanine--tRNA ligase beta subunit [Phialophora attinorum]